MSSWNSWQYTVFFSFRLKFSVRHCRKVKCDCLKPISKWHITIKTKGKELPSWVSRKHYCFGPNFETFRWEKYLNKANNPILVPLYLKNVKMILPTSSKNKNLVKETLKTSLKNPYDLEKLLQNYSEGKA